MKTITKGQYLYLKSKKNAELLKNETVTIEDEEYEDLIQYSNKQITPINNNPIEPEPIEPTPGGDIPIPGEEDPDHDYSQDYLTFETLEDGTFSFTINDLYYSTNNGASWKSLAAGTETELITKGTKVLWKKDSDIINKDLNTFNGSTTGSGIGNFSSTGKFAVFGNIMSLLFINFIDAVIPNNNSFYDYSFNHLFENCINLITAENLIFPNKLFVDSGAYYGPYCDMFKYTFANCSNMIIGPKKLPDVSYRSYAYMFQNCSSLINAPILPSVNLIKGCYNNMFDGCTSLKYIKMLGNNIVANVHLNNWVKGVLPGGIFIKNSKSTFNNIGDSGIPAGWEVIDEEVPEEE